MRILFFAVLILTTTAALFGAEYTFVLKDVDANRILVEEGDVSSEMSPYCSFNIILSLIGFDTGVLQSPDNPLWPFKEEYAEEYLTWNESYPEKWRADHNPAAWMRNSCVWFSQELARKLGAKTMTDYVEKFAYGNQNLEGDSGKANGLTRFWIGSSLRISPSEQIALIERLVKGEMPVSEEAHIHTKSILFVENLPNGMALYGKSGSGSYANGREEPMLRVSWFVGWVEQGERKLAFVYRLNGDEPSIIGAARDQLKQRLLQKLR